jgi:hypothetical protein
MLEFLRKTDPHLDRFLTKRKGIQPDDHLSFDYTAIRQLMNQEFPELVAQLGNADGRKVIKRRPREADLSPLARVGKKP